LNFSSIPTKPVVGPITPRDDVADNFDHFDFKSQLARR
jgi:hypothetical protein